MIFGVGVDLVEVARIRAARQRWGDRLLKRLFTEGELGYSLDSAQADQRLAARFAAKEAFLKALGTGLSLGARWREIEVVSDGGGPPMLRLTGRSAEIFRSRGIARSFLSLSHGTDSAVALVVLEK